MHEQGTRPESWDFSRPDHATRYRASFGSIQRAAVVNTTMASWKARLSRLNPQHGKRQARLDANLRSEGNEWMPEILNRRRKRDEREKAIDLALHQERRQGSNWLETANCAPGRCISNGNAE